MCGEWLFTEPRGEREYNGCWSVFVAEVVLYDDYGAAAALFTALRRREVGVVDVATVNDGLIVFHWYVPSFFKY